VRYISDQAGVSSLIKHLAGTEEKVFSLQSAKQQFLPAIAPRILASHIDLYQLHI
jgi:hypothetical protein